MHYILLEALFAYFQTFGLLALERLLLGWLVTIFAMDKKVGKVKQERRGRKKGHQ